MIQQAKKPGRGCLFYGSLVGGVLLFVIIVGTLIGLRYAKAVVNQLTDTKPLSFPEVKLTEAQMNLLRDRMARFQDDIKDGVPTPPLQLTAEEINALIQTEPSLVSLKNHLYITIDGNQLRAQMSFPTEQVGLRPLTGRFVNAQGNFKISLYKGELRVAAETLTAKGKPVPEHIMRQVRTQNLAADLNKDPNAAEGIKNIRNIDVKDGKLIIEAMKSAAAK
jgi:hypothetical protein